MISGFRDGESSGFTFQGRRSTVIGLSAGFDFLYFYELRASEFDIHPSIFDQLPSLTSTSTLSFHPPLP